MKKGYYAVKLYFFPIPSLGNWCKLHFSVNIKNTVCIMAFVCVPLNILLIKL